MRDPWDHFSNNFAAKFVNLCGADADRKYLQNGRRPQDEVKRFYLVCECDHAAVDEPDSNMEVILCNTTALIEHEQQ